MKEGVKKAYHREMADIENSLLKKTQTTNKILLKNGNFKKINLLYTVFFLSFSVLVAQEIDFLITDVNIYTDGSLNIDLTKEAKDQIIEPFESVLSQDEIGRNPELKLYFYQDTDEIHLELPSSTKSFFLSASSFGRGLNFRSENQYDMFSISYIFNLYERSGSYYSAKYTWNEREVVANIRLNLSKAFGYIRGGTLENVGENLKGERTHKTVITFERK